MKTLILIEVEYDETKVDHPSEWSKELKLWDLGSLLGSGQVDARVASAPSPPDEYEQVGSLDSHGKFWPLDGDEIEGYDVPVFVRRSPNPPMLTHLRSLPDFALSHQEVGWICDEIERLRGAPSPPDEYEQVGWIDSTFGTRFTKQPPFSGEGWVPVFVRRSPNPPEAQT